MRLNDEQAVMVGKSLTLEERIELQAQEIRALQQEKEVLVETILQLKDEKEQLRAQAAKMKEAFRQVQRDIDSAECNLNGLKEYIDDVLFVVSTHTGYHNPADKEVEDI